MLKNIGSIEIDRYFKNKYPLLMVDFISELEPGKRSKGYKNFSNNEWFFPIHFKDNSNVPGSIMLEAMLDIFVMTIVTLPECEGKETADVKVNNLLFKRKIIPGERLDMECQVDSFRRGIASGKVVGKVGDQFTCSCDVVICVPDLMISMTR